MNGQSKNPRIEWTIQESANWANDSELTQKNSFAFFDVSMSARKLTIESRSQYFWQWATFHRLSAGEHGSVKKIIRGNSWKIQESGNWANDSELTQKNSFAFFDVSMSARKLTIESRSQYSLQSATFHRSSADEHGSVKKIIHGNSWKIQESGNWANDGELTRKNSFTYFDVSMSARKLTIECRSQYSWQSATFHRSSADEHGSVKKN